MQNLSKQNEMPFELAHFQVEELEERLENCWQGQEWVSDGWYDQYGDYHDTSYKQAC